MAQFDTRVRFNWGFHDGAADAGRGTWKPGGILTPDKPHFDKPYEQGYRAGHAAARDGEDTSSSELAWKTRCTCKDRLGFHAEKCRASQSTSI